MLEDWVTVQEWVVRIELLLRCGVYSSRDVLEVLGLFCVQLLVASNVGPNESKQRESDNGGMHGLDVARHDKVPLLSASVCARIGRENALRVRPLLCGIIQHQSGCQ